MAKRRSKKRNYLTMDVELAELAYVLHGNANRLRATATHINITAAFRMQLLRMEQRMVKLSRSLGVELDEPKGSKEPPPDIFEKMEDAKTKPVKRSNKPAAAKEPVVRDNQLERAIDIMKAIKVYKR